jgi:hypothetical protein
MKRVFPAVWVLACALLAASGCDKGASDAQPKLQNPNDPKLKSMQPASPGAGGTKQAPVAQ